MKTASDAASDMSSRSTRYAPKVGDAVRLLVLLAHRHPGVGDDDVGARRRPPRHPCTASTEPPVGGRDAVGVGDDGCRGRELLGRGDPHVHARGHAGEHVRLRHVRRAVAEEGDGEAGEVALVLADGEQVGEQLARVEVVGEGVHDRHGGARRHLLEAGLAVGAPDDGRRPCARARGRCRTGSPCRRAGCSRSR